MKLLLVGGGNMGTALLAGWQKNIPDLQVHVVEPYPSDRLKALCINGNTLYETARNIFAAFDAVILAIKPQNFSDILPDLKSYIQQNTFVLSIAAGKTLQGMASILGDDVAIIRTMPNTPALIGEGMSVLVANALVNEKQKHTATQLMQAVGKALWVNDEDLMHAVTAVSGSGPAYVFAMIEAMQKAGEAQGLSSDMALELARQTMLGATMLADSQQEIAPSELRRQVTSPKGTTEAALDVLLADEGLNALMHKAIQAAAQRSKELA